MGPGKRAVKRLWCGGTPVTITMYRQTDIYWPLFRDNLGKPAPESYTNTPIWISVKQEMIGWHWHQLDHMHIICTLIQTDNHVSTSSLSFVIGRMVFPTPDKQCQSTEGRWNKNEQKTKNCSFCPWLLCVFISMASARYVVW